MHGHPRSNRLRLLPISRKEEIKPFAGGAAASRPTPSNGGSARGIPGCKLGQLVAQLRSLVERRGASATASSVAQSSRSRAIEKLLSIQSLPWWPFDWESMPTDGDTRLTLKLRRVWVDGGERAAGGGDGVQGGGATRSASPELAQAYRLE